MEGGRVINDLAVGRAPTSRQAFAAEALGVLMERLRRSGDRCGRLAAALRAGAPGDGDLGELDAALRELERDGFNFGWLAAELGSDVLFARRERAGLSDGFALVEAMLALRGRSAKLPEPVELDPSDARCSELCAQITRLVFVACSQASPARVGISTAEPSGFARELSVDGAIEPALARELIDCARAIAGSRLILTSSSARWTFDSTR